MSFWTCPRCRSQHIHTPGEECIYPDDLYRVQFKVKMPMSEPDFRVIVAFNAGNFLETNFDRFTEITQHYRNLEFTTVPVDLSRATELKLRFSGTMKKIEK